MIDRRYTPMSPKKRKYYRRFCFLPGNFILALTMSGVTGVLIMEDIVSVGEAWKQPLYILFCFVGPPVCVFGGLLLMWYYHRKMRSMS
jgi:hypothetical protein